jgi:hypothetical protein
MIGAPQLRRLRSAPFRLSRGGQVYTRAHLLDGGTGGSITRIQVGLRPAMLERAQEGADQRNGDNRMG